MKIQYGENFSLDTDECNDDTLHIGVRGFGTLQIEVNLKELAVRLLKPDSGSVEPFVEFTAPHEVFGDGVPSVKVRSGEPVAPAHPEDYCHRCKGPNVSWSAPSELWNAVMRTAGVDRFDGIVCPTCFAVLAKAAGVDQTWCLKTKAAENEA